tara:strand:+ start:2276 stop:2506 length:231 start_codon:yes stop_codon:yes gene_type:complete
MPLFGGNKEEREKRREDKQSYRIERIKALTAKAYAVASKRKWLVYLIGLGIIVYFIISSGGLAGLSGLTEKVKSFF